YGLRQVKHFVEISLPTIEPSLPENTHVQGINAEGKVQAVNTETQQGYIWISDLQWQERPIATADVDLKQDFLDVWEIFNLQAYDLIDLSHIHRDFFTALSCLMGCFSLPELSIVYSIKHMSLQRTGV